MSSKINLVLLNKNHIEFVLGAEWSTIDQMIRDGKFPRENLSTKPRKWLWDSVVNWAVKLRAENPELSNQYLERLQQVHQIELAVQANAAA